MAGNLASKKELLTRMRIGINLKTKDSLASRSSLLMCQMSWHLQNRNHHQFRKKKPPLLRVQQLLLHLKLMLSQNSLKAEVVENGAAYDKNEDESAKSAPNSPFASSTVGSPSREFSDSNYGKTTDADASPRNKESQSDDHTGAGSMFSGDKGSDEPAWVTFDPNDDVDSVWGFNAVSTTKDMDQESNKDHYFSGPGEFGLNPIRTGSSQGGGFSQKSRPFTFDDSVPSTPLSAFNSGYSPPRYKDSSEPSFDTFSRFDSFRSAQDTGFFPQPETLGRFDSMRSSRDFDQGNGFQHLMTSQTLLALRCHLGHRWTVKLQEETQTPSDLQVHFGRQWTVKFQEENQIFSGLQRRRLGHHLTVKLQEETRTHLGPLHLGHHSTVKLQEETRMLSLNLPVSSAPCSLELEHYMAPGVLAQIEDARSRLS